MSTPTTFKEFVSLFIDIVNLSIWAIIAVVFVVMVWKIFDAWIINAGDERKRTEGKQVALTATIVFVIMLTIWGIVRMVQNSIFG